MNTSISSRKAADTLASCLVFIAALLLLSLPQNGRADAASAADNSQIAKVSFTLNPDKVICAVPSDFTGLSFEKNVLASRHFNPTNQVMLNLFSNLGPGVLRFGGNSVDETYWSRVPGKKFPKAKAVIHPADLQRVLDFSKKCGWRVILGFNLGANDPEMAADEAAFALEHGGDSILAFEIGNEPEHLKDTGMRATNYAYADYRKEVEAYVTAMHKRCARVPLAGPATTSNLEWFKDFIRDFKADTVLTTRHHYPLTAAKTTTPENPRYATIENLLSQKTAAASMKLLTQHELASEQANIPFRIGETGSASVGGKNGVSDVFASALWAVDYMFSTAERGIEGVNFHGYFSCHGYTAFCFSDGQYHAHPSYYGLLLFNQAGRGHLISVEETNSANLNAHAVLGDDKTIHVVLVNKSLAQAENAAINIPRESDSARLVFLSAPSPDSTDGTKLGGAEVQSDGTWNQNSGQLLNIKDGTIQLTMPASSAALITIFQKNKAKLAANN